MDSMVETLQWYLTERIRKRIANFILNRATPEQIEKIDDFIFNEIVGEDYNE